MKLKYIVAFWQTVLWFCVILYLSFAPKGSFDESLQLFENQDKVIHACMYLGLAFLCLKDYAKLHTLSRKVQILLFIFVFSISGVIEILQPILSNRTLEAYDFLSNGFGSLLGVGFSKLWIRMFNP